MNSALLRQAIKDRFCAPEFAVCFEVANRTGSASRYADAVAMNLYNSRGLELHGFEIKVSRGDWLNELKKPAKAEEISKFCNRWWIVAPDGIVKKDELPVTWGLLTYKDGKLRQSVQAPKLKPEPLSRQFVAALFRRSNELDEETLKIAISKEVEKIRADCEKKLQSSIKNRFVDNEMYAKRIKEIKELTGLDLMTYTPSVDVAHAIQAVIKSGVAGSYNNISRAMASVKLAQKNMEEALKIFPEMQELDNINDLVT